MLLTHMIKVYTVLYHFQWQFEYNISSVGMQRSNVFQASDSTDSIKRIANAYVSVRIASTLPNHLWASLRQILELNDVCIEKSYFDLIYLKVRYGDFYFSPTDTALPYFASNVHHFKAPWDMFECSIYHGCILGYTK